jgi:hypothetical protein
MCGIAQSVVRVVSVAQVLLRAHLRHPVQNIGLTTIRSVCVALLTMLSLWYG